MAQQTVSEKDMYLSSFEQEFLTTLRVLKAYPPAKIDLKPHERSQRAGDLAWTMVLNQILVDAILNQAELTPSGLPPTPKKWQDIVDGLEQAHRDAVAKLNKADVDRLNGSLRMPVGPRQMSDVRRGSALWMMLCDTIHHRGQLSVYLRMAGGKVPSIYGPSADEPWH